MSYSHETTSRVPLSPPFKSSVLIVEDEFITINTLQLMLQKEGYTVCGHAYSVAEALVMIEEHRPDMVLLDIYLQGEQNGIDLAKHLNQENIPFIFISAYSNASLIEEAKATHPYGYLVKPFREQDVLVTLEIAYYRHLNNRELALQKEQNLLLRLGKEYTQVQTKNGLLTILYQELTSMLPLTDLELILWHEESVLTTWMRWDKQLASPYIESTRANLIAIQPFSEWLYKLSEITILKPKDWFNIFPGGSKHFSTTGISQPESVAIPLKKSDKLIGSLVLHSHHSGSLHSWRKQLFQGIGDQLAGTLANLLAHEEKMQREQEDSLQQVLIQILSEASDWEQKLLRVAKAIQLHIPFDFIVLGLNQEKSTNPHCAFFRLGFEEYQIIQVEDLFHMLGINAQQYGQLLQEMVYQEAAIWQEDGFKAICKQYRLKGLLAKKFNMYSNLTMPLPVARGGTFAVSLYSRDTHVYLPEHLALLERLKPSLILTLDRLFALGEIEMLKHQLGNGLLPLPPLVHESSGFAGIIGRSANIRRVFELTSHVAPVNTTVLIQGESGTGKELFAKAIHQLSPRKDKPLIKVNCATIPANLIESELFGHEKGSFTGAIDKRIGKFELANSGTIFLDEIGEMPLDLQVKLLRVLQEREFERIGGKSSIKVDVRIIAATNRQLKTEVTEGRFRLDLFYRLNVFPLTLPPLRERAEDICLLAEHFAQNICQQMGKYYKGMASSLKESLLHYSWPGNIRELENIMERIVIMHDGQNLLESENLLENNTTVLERATYSTPSKPKTLMATEREYILSILEQTGWRIRGKNGAAEVLSIKPTTLEYRMGKLGIKRIRNSQNSA